MCQFINIKKTSLNYEQQINQPNSSRGKALIRSMDAELKILFVCFQTMGKKEDDISS